MSDHALGTIAARAAQQWGDKTLLVVDAEDEHLSYSAFDLRANQFAAALAESSVRSGSRVAVMLTNRQEFPVLWMGILKLGAVMVPLNVHLKQNDLAHILGHSAPTAIIFEPEFAPLVTSVVADLNLDAVTAQIGEDGQFAPLVAQTPDTRVAVEVYPEAPANIQYTSGTTGRPKGCVLSHSYWLAIARAHIREGPRIQAEDVLLTAQPFYYMDPQWTLVTAMVAGATAVMLDGFHPGTFWQAVGKHSATFFYCLGVMPRMLVNTPSQAADREHTVREIRCSAIPPRLHRALEERWGAPWLEIYGSTETGSDIAMPTNEHTAAVGSGSIGRPLEQREVKVVDEHDVPVARGEVGQLLVRGRGMMDEYYQDPKATAKAFRGGWFHTGDLVRWDPDGRLYFVGRSKEMIRRSGENISPDEVKETLEEHPAVEIAVVFPVPDEIRGEEGKAYVQPHKGTVKGTEESNTELIQDLVAFLGDRLAYFKIPRYWEVRTELPRTPSERVARSVLVNERADLRNGSYDCVDDVWL